MDKFDNNKRKKSQDKIEKVFLQLIQKYDINQISVSNICKLAKINRSTFYSNYIDIFDLKDKIKEKMFNNILELYQNEAIKKEHSYDYLKLFKHIKENQIYYQTLFKLDFDFSDYYDEHLENNYALKYYGTTKNIEYHKVFFKAGIRAIIKKWLENGCKEEPEEINEILISEYQSKI